MSAKLTRVLRKMDACNEAVEWARDYDTLQAAWDACERADWMCWLLVQLHPQGCGQVRLALCACARTALKHVPAGEERPRLAIECAERYARGASTDAELAAAGAAARDVAWAAAWDFVWDAARVAAGAAAGAAARDAAWDSAGAAARAAAWDSARDAAGAAARAAAWDSARDAALKEMSDIVRRMIPDPEHLPKLEDM